jgi:fatty acid amide hydrolase 2
MLGIGPIARRAEDLIAVLRIVAGPDGVDRFARAIELGDPATVSLQGLRVVLAEGTSWRPMSRELHEARERAAGALTAAGARLERVKLPSWRGALLPFLTTLALGSGSSTSELLTTAGARAPTARSLLTPGGHHTMATRITLLSELLPQPEPGSARARKLLDHGRELGDELTATIGDGVLLHPAHRRSAPRHGTTVGRPWLLTPSAIFNLAGVPVTEVPLGRNRQGLPLGVQVAAGPERDHVSIAVAMALERAFGGWTAPAR